MAEIIKIRGQKPCGVFFNAPINPETSSVLIAAMSSAVSQKYDEIHFFLNTPGGMIADGIASYNFLRSLPVQIIIYNIGAVNSVGNAVYQAADKRICAETSSFMFHGVGIDVNNIRLELKQLNEMTKSVQNDQDQISKIIVERTGLSLEDVNELFLNMEYLKADEAFKRGITDEVRDIHLPEGLPIIPLVFKG